MWNGQEPTPAMHSSTKWQNISLDDVGFRQMLGATILFLIGSSALARDDGFGDEFTLFTPLILDVFQKILRWILNISRHIGLDRYFLSGGLPIAAHDPTDV